MIPNNLKEYVNLKEGGVIFQKNSHLRAMYVE